MQACMAIPNSSMWPYLVVGFPTLTLVLDPCWLKLLAAANTTPLWCHKEDSILNPYLLPSNVKLSLPTMQIDTATIEGYPDQ